MGLKADKRKKDGRNANFRSPSKLRAILKWPDLHDDGALKRAAAESIRAKHCFIRIVDTTCQSFMLL